MTCVFCAIAAGEERASLVAEDERALAFLNLHAVNPGHTLVIPRTHAPDLVSLDPADGAAVFRTAARVAKGLRSGPLRAEGVNLLLNDGAPAGQDVAHVHLHVVPRYPGDGFEYRMPERHAEAVPRDTLDATAALLREAIGAS
ncbi:MAG TPA: HIT family protein [Candidatus Limnocylindria bacterium]|nr:HIT family protein [Candidatus Limnocylindria bacterium]